MAPHMPGTFQGAATSGWIASRTSVAEAEPRAPRRRLLDQVRDALRLRHYSRRTERAYVGWIRRFILFDCKRHPAEMGAAEVSSFLSFLAVESKVSAPTQNQARLGFIASTVPFSLDEVRAKATDVGITIPARVDMTFLQAKEWSCMWKPLA